MIPRSQSIWTGRHSMRMLWYTEDVAGLYTQYQSTFCSSVHGSFPVGKRTLKDSGTNDIVT